MLKNFRVFRPRIPSQSTNFNPKFCTWLELAGGRDPPDPPLATRMSTLLSPPEIYEVLLNLLICGPK